MEGRRYRSPGPNYWQEKSESGGMPGRDRTCDLRIQPTCPGRAGSVDFRGRVEFCPRHRRGPVLLLAQEFGLLRVRGSRNLLVNAKRQKGSTMR
jgi:hypothetical protein